MDLSNLLSSLLSSLPTYSIPQTIVKRSSNDSARNNLPANECLKRNCSIADGSFINFDRRYLIEPARRGDARRGEERRGEVLLCYPADGRGGGRGWACLEENLSGGRVSLILSRMERWFCNWAGVYWLVKRSWEIFLFFGEGGGGGGGRLHSLEQCLNWRLPWYSNVAWDTAPFSFVLIILIYGKYKYTCMYRSCYSWKCVCICICIFFKVRSYDLCSLHLRRFLFTPFFFFFIIATLSLSTQQSVLQWSHVQ